ncbi:hypothetical protein BO71DRAFT_401186 [Aspergillus ellipticus CBS 707.79]|uniref:Uncharacterized protein n=1 Tax=Aspergillus ellipticus CBS 707.79 TaxID=1448320 RepID=A0A319DBH9_9EURO|nr:hypothetical protein BO71DRAFT_401186 [Aspergillus ellipticus CBS 707.79]
MRAMAEEQACDQPRLHDLPVSVSVSVSCLLSPVGWPPDRNLDHIPYLTPCSVSVPSSTTHLVDIEGIQSLLTTYGRQSVSTYLRTREALGQLRWLLAIADPPGWTICDLPLRNCSGGWVHVFPIPWISFW